MKLKEIELTDDELQFAMADWLDQTDEDIDVWDMIDITTPSETIQQIVDAINGHLDGGTVNATGADESESVDLTFVSNSEGYGVEGFEFTYVLYPAQRRSPALRLGSMFYETGDFIPKHTGIAGAVEMGRDVLTIVNMGIRAYNDFASREVAP